MLTVVSLGAGVQSTTVVLMAAAGELTPMPDCAIFADTGAEPAAVYTHLQWLMAPGRLPFPVHVVSAGFNLRDELLLAMEGKGRRGSHARPPLYVTNPDGTAGMIRRQCTGDFKVVPIQKKVRELLGLKPRARWPKEVRVQQWLGISLDEAARMKDSQVPTIQNVYPLIDRHLRRRDCLRWLEAHGFAEPPKSACTFCPFHNDAQWRHLRDTDPVGWADAVKVDEAIRLGFRRHHKLHGTFYVHPSRVPLVEVDLSTAEDRGQLNLFMNECEGHCGL